MSTFTVRVLPALDPGESYTEANFVMVETMSNKRGEAVSTIDHVITVGQPTGWSVTPLCRGEALTHAEALEWALAYAKANEIPIVYVRDETSAAPSSP